jgi:hypothetical protein
MLLVNVRLKLELNVSVMHTSFAANAWFHPAQTVSLAVAIHLVQTAGFSYTVIIRMTAICEMIGAIRF